MQMPTLLELIVTKEIEKIKGGKADGMSPKDFDQDQLMKGVKHEFEHTGDLKTAMEIAMDHLVSDKDYYKKLQKIEKD